MPIDFSCPKCRKKYRVKDDLAGKNAKCAKCNTRIKIPVPVPVPELEELELQSDLGSWFDEELSNSGTSPVASTSGFARRSGKTCSACGAELGENAVLCVACGYDLRDGRKHTIEKIFDEPAPKRSSKAKHAATLMRGAIFSAIGALLGAAVWGAVAVFTGYEIGYIAWGLGFVAGAGMALGHEDDDGTLAGLVAAGMALMGIFAAKFFIFQHFKSELASEGFDLDTVADSMGTTFTLMMLFGPIDILFIIFALGTAYKIGSGRATS